MSSKRTPWWYYVIGAVLGFLFGIIAATWTSKHSSAMMSAPWYLSASIVAVGAVVTWSAWQVRRFVEGKITKMAPQRSVNTLIFAKALGLSAAVLSGWYLGLFIITIQHFEIAYFATITFELAGAIVACFIDLGLGILSEFWCLLPPAGEKDE
ncbi:DUF3180 domain-containing protein [Alloscardovia criceti]|uniref:DUF3180 domain-containing protein n=1 Tax=Alloscardovia criceti TaxID=356828 RepID=UPI000375CC1F|nr:DUF3180 domain-containing protein [Alloscardovia criceti]